MKYKTTQAHQNPPPEAVTDSGLLGDGVEGAPPTPHDTLSYPRKKAPSPLQES